MATIELRGVHKRYDEKTHVVKGLDLSIADGEFVVLVGPSGCGKSTTLRMIAGLETITEGDLLIDGVRVNDVPPAGRDLAMVFQSYALYPHMSVFDNIAFGLKVRRMPTAEIKKRVDEVAEMLGLTEYLQRKPAQLSGGQRQRVAMGRAIVRQAKCFLFDEPLSNLDAKLRTEVRAEIARVRRTLGVTTVYVTHDQVEAMTLADRVVVLNEGIAQQVGHPMEVYRQPANRFVAAFLGTPTMNFLEGQAKDGAFVSGEAPFTVPKLPEAATSIGIRPHDVLAGVRAEGSEIVEMGEIEVDVIERLGAESFAFGALNGVRVAARIDEEHGIIEHGQRLPVTASRERLLFFDDSGVRLSA